MAVLAAIGALISAGCGGGAHERARGSNQCRAAVGFEGPINQPLGKEQLAFAQLAVADDNSSNATKITLQPADTRSSPPRASTISDQFVARSGVLGVIGPASNREVDAVGSAFARAGIAFISPSATGSPLTAGANPTFFRVVAPDRLEGPQEARFIVTRLRPKTVLIVDDFTAYGSQVADSMLTPLRVARIAVDRASASGRPATAAGSLVARITPAIPVVVLDWYAPRAAQQFGHALSQQRKVVTLVGPDRLFAPGTFRVQGAYVASPGPDIAQLPTEASSVQRIRRSVPAFGIAGPLAYAATHVLDQAIARVCKAGHLPSRSDVLAAIRNTAEATSILGRPIRFQANGELVDPRWFLFRIDSAGRYRLVP